MKLETIAGAAVLAAVMLFFSPAVRADDVFTGVTKAKVAWDVTIGDEAKFNDRIKLITTTAQMLQSRGIEPDFVLLIHGGATKFVTKTLDGTKFAKSKGKIKDMPETQAYMKSMKDEGIKLEVCAVAMFRTKVKRENVQPFVTVQDNVWENLIVLQNKGYAYMPVH